MTDEPKKRGRPKGPDKVTIPIRVTVEVAEWLEAKAESFGAKNVPTYLARNFELWKAWESQGTKEFHFDEKENENE